MQKLRTFFPGSGSQHISPTTEFASRHSVVLEPEVGFQITIETYQQTTHAQTHTQAQTIPHSSATGETSIQQKITIPELNVQLFAARHLPNLFGFKVVQGYQVKVKLFPGSKRLDSSIQTNSWPKFNENFRFPLAPDIKPSLKHSVARRSSKSAVSELFTPEELFAGQFVVFTVYALLELPPASFSRFNKTYRSLKDKSSNFVQNLVEGSNGKAKEDKENDGAATTTTPMENGYGNGNGNGNSNGNGNGNGQKPKRKSFEPNYRDAMPALTISESRRNIGSVTCYLEPKIFKRNPRTGHYATEELWLPIKDITTTAKKNQSNDLTNAPKGIIEMILELRDSSKLNTPEINGQGAESNFGPFEKFKPGWTPPATPTMPTMPTILNNSSKITATHNGHSNKNSTTNINNSHNNNNHNNNNNNYFNINKNMKTKNQQWQRMTAEVKRKMGFSNVSRSALENNGLILRITTARMRCTQKVKDELECTAGSVYVKTAVFEHGIFVDSWKSPNFYPSLSTKMGGGDIVNDDIATLDIPLKSHDSLENILIRVTLATKSKLGKKLVLGTVLIGSKVTSRNGNGAAHMQQLLEGMSNERISMWHKYQ